MATVAELKAVLKDTLEKRGALAQIKARIRAEVFNALDDQSEPRPTLSRENLLINELIREYLEYNKYKYTASVLTAESGQPEVPLDREFLARELNIVEDASGKSVPLLYGILSHFLHGGKEESTQNILPKASLLTYSKQSLGKPPAERNQKGRLQRQQGLGLSRLVAVSPTHSAHPVGHLCLLSQNGSKTSQR
ncbi:lisH domain-containing protein FOPNL isoform X2 [Cyanistes caeruleus]|nr:lisH domain-containing protein FOPNL isoform X2 [Cyanistes caeruleus]